jgi:hypothetical protein
LADVVGVVHGIGFSVPLLPLPPACDSASPADALSAISSSLLPLPGAGDAETDERAPGVTLPAAAAAAVLMLLLLLASGCGTSSGCC